MKFIGRNSWDWKGLADQSDPGQDSTLSLIGWREWCRLDELGLGWIDARMDTGTRTSAIHVSDIRPYSESGRQKVEFIVHPQEDNDTVVICNVAVIDQLEVKGPNEYREMRWVIQSTVSLGELRWVIPLTITSQKYVSFRMTLARTALQGKFLVDSSQTYLIGNRLS